MKLRYRLSFLFLVVIGVSAATALILVRQSTNSMFRSFVFEGDSEKAKAYAVILAEYHLEKGDWDEVQGFLVGLPDLLSRVIDTNIHGEDGLMAFTGYPAATLRSLLADRVVVADSDGLIVADTAGEILRTLHPSRHLDHGAPIKSGS